MASAKSTKCPYCGGGWKGVSRRHLAQCARKNRSQAQMPQATTEHRSRQATSASASDPAYSRMYATMQEERSRKTEPSGPATPAGQAFAEAAASEAEAMHRSVTESGGFTGSVTDAKPLSAGCVINHVGSCPTLPADASANDLRDCLSQNADWFTEDGNRHFGLWQDPDRGVLVLDRVTVAPDVETATSIAKERKQRAFYDLGTGTTHNL